MHSTILSILSSRLERCFRALKKRHPNRTDIEPLIQAIKGNLHYERSVYSSMTELEQWTTAPHNTRITLNTSLKNTVQQLAQWTNAGSLQLNPPSYTHRQLYASLKILGAAKSLRAIIDEVKAQTDAGNGAAALDIGVSLICSPIVENSAISVDWVGSPVPAPPSPRTRINLREMLKVDFDNAASLVSTDPLAAETIVRLHRRVEAQLAAVASSGGLPTAQIGLPNVELTSMQTQNMGDADLDKAMNDAAAATIAAGGDIGMGSKALQRTLDAQLDMAAANAGMDLSMGGMDGMGVGEAADGSMSADLGNLPDLDLGDMGDMGMGMGDDDDEWGLDFDNM
jgi:mediator of RNA polymerase II transcription subunit 5